MATSQVETVNTGADKAKLAAAVALVIAAVGTIVLGVLPHYVLEWAEVSAAGLLQLPAGLVGAGAR